MKYRSLVLVLIIAGITALASAQEAPDPASSSQAVTPAAESGVLGLRLGLDLFTSVLDASKNTNGTRLLAEYALMTPFALVVDLGYHGGSVSGQSWYMLDLGISGRWYALGQNLLYPAKTGKGGLFLQAGLSLDFYDNGWQSLVGADDPALKWGLILGIGYQWSPFGSQGPYLEPALLSGIKFNSYSAFRGGLTLGWAF